MHTSGSFGFCHVTDSIRCYASTQHGQDESQCTILTSASLAGIVALTKMSPVRCTSACYMCDVAGKGLIKEAGMTTPHWSVQPNLLCTAMCLPPFEQLPDADTRLFVEQAAIAVSQSLFRRSLAVSAARLPKQAAIMRTIQSGLLQR